MSALRGFRYPALLLALYGAIWLALAVHPWYRQDWLLENLLVFATVPVYVATARRLRFTDAAYTCLFAFYLLHAVGAHYTYAEVPYDRWAEALVGRPIGPLLGWHRNHYDRVVHFAYGLLITPLALQLFAARAPPRGLWRWLLPWLFMVSHGAVYELVEWAAAERFGGDLGAAYLGTQGDPWDAQRDMALAALGSAVTLAVAAARGTLPGPLLDSGRCFRGGPREARHRHHQAVQAGRSSRSAPRRGGAGPHCDGGQGIRAAEGPH